MGKVYLETTDSIWSINNNSTTIYGTSALTDRVSISAGITGAIIDSTIERTDLSGDISNYKMKQGFGSNMEVQDLNGNIIMTLASVSGKQLSFNNSVVDLAYIGGKVSVGGTVISSTATVITPSTNNSLTNYSTMAAGKSATNATLGSALSNVSTFGVSSLDSSYHWNTASQSITYSFNATIPASYAASTDGLTVNWTALNTAQEAAVTSIMQGLNSLIGTTVTPISSGGLIRFNIIDMGAGTAGFAYQPGPGTGDLTGDIFLSSGFNTIPADFSLSVGGQGWTTIAHELGHAMGLDHPATGGVYGNQGKNSTTLATAFDDTNHTIMSYTGKDNQILNFTLSGNSLSYKGSLIASDLYSLYDVETLQSIYGVNTTTNTQDNIYSVKYTDYKTQTIWDAGGTDTIDLSSALGSSTLDLNTSTGGTINSADQYTFQQIVALQQSLVNNAGFNTFIETSLQTLNTTGELYTGKNNLGIAQGVIIENVYTGSGADTITDNEVDNIISTYLGDDKIYLGQGGYDTVDGGGGNDTIFLNLLASQVNMEKQANGSYILVADTFAVNFTGIETIQYSDNSTLAIA